MTPLTQQLEDKKKGCGKKFEYTNDYYINCGNRFANTDKILCETCQAEIAILEQAIAEMQKQRQEILKKIESILEGYSNNWSLYNGNDIISLKSVFKDIEKQLNQPKEEGKA